MNLSAPVLLSCLARNIGILSRDICVEQLVQLLNRIYKELVQSGSEIKFVPSLADKAMSKWGIKSPKNHKSEAKSLCTGDIQKQE